MKTIEETHPSLRGKGFDMKEVVDYLEGRVVYATNVQEHTVDKQVLRDIFTKYDLKVWCPECHAEMKPYTHLCERCGERVNPVDTNGFTELWKELGL
jgi:peptide subunit release factor 1 (eRF1)